MTAPTYNLIYCEDFPFHLISHGPDQSVGRMSCTAGECAKGGWLCRLVCPCICPVSPVIIAMKDKRVSLSLFHASPMCAQYRALLWRPGGLAPAGGVPGVAQQRPSCQAQVSWRPPDQHPTRGRSHNLCHQIANFELFCSARIAQII